MINVAIIGSGSISRMHIEGYLAFPERCDIVALCDIEYENCVKTKEKFALKDEVRLFSSHTDMLEKMRGGIEVVSICTPPYTHAALTIDCLDAGINVVCEKPMAASLEECDAMLEAEKKSGKMLCCVAQNRFRDTILSLKKVVRSGRIGKTLHAQVDSFWWRGLHYYDLWWRGAWETEGGGCTLNHAVHHIDMLIWMLGMPEKVTAVISNVAHTNAEVEDISVATLQYGESEVCAKGALAQITSSVIHHGEEQQLIFQTEKARVSAPWKVTANLAAPNAFPMREHDEALERELTEFVESQEPLKYTNHTGEIDDVLTALEKRRKGADTQPLTTSEDGRNTLELITAIYKAGATGVCVKLPIAKDDPFYTVKGIMASVPHFYEKTAVARGFPGEITTSGNRA
ncbi:MAG: Gfo/Idh/MocA family oxidoreductase [Treponema sp.]|jgi:predicted dehydrogenase|nr:Gfo/Idh/MocA family oxidoreductase [Treponema sp.]